jgi:hypothetical protein
MREREGACRVWRENITEIHYLEIIDVDRRVEIKWIFRK